MNEQPALAEVADDLVRRLRRRETVQPAVVVVEAPRLVDRREHVEAVHLGELEVLAAAARRDVDDPGALIERDLVPRDDAVLDRPAGTEIVEGARVAPADELLAALPLRKRLVRVERDGDPLAALAPAVLRVRLDRSGDVRRQRPRRRRPDHERLARPVEQREPDEQRGIGAILVDARLRELVLGERRAAARAPLGRAVAHVEPAALVDALQEPPDVLDVRVAEGEVVLAPVHPLPEPHRALGQRARGLDDDLAAAACELGEAELLDLALRVQPELALDADLDPEALAVEPVLVAQLVAAERLVALEDVLERPPPGGVDAEHHPVRRDGAVDEAELGPPRFSARSCSNVPSRSQSSRISSSSAGGRACPAGV